MGERTLLRVNLSYLYSKLFSTISKHISTPIPWRRMFSTSAAARTEHYRLVVAGGGTAGTAMSNKFSKILGKGQVALVEPKEQHHYQAMWTMVGAGFVKEFQKSMKPQKDFVHRNCTLIQDRIGQFLPDKDTVITGSGRQIFYDYLIIALGLEARYDQIKGLPAALETPGVCSIFHPKYVLKTHPEIQGFKGGNAIFTFPTGRVKCAGAMHSIMYLAEEAFRNNGVRDKANISFNSGVPSIFSSPYYADILHEFMQNRGLTFNGKHRLSEVDSDTKEAVFDVLGDEGKTVLYKKTMKVLCYTCGLKMAFHS